MEGFDRVPAAAEGEAGYKKRILPYREAKPQSLPGSQESIGAGGLGPQPLFIFCFQVGSNPSAARQTGFDQVPAAAKGEAGYKNRTLPCRKAKP